MLNHCTAQRSYGVFNVSLALTSISDDTLVRTHGLAARAHILESPSSPLSDISLFPSTYTSSRKRKCGASQKWLRTSRRLASTCLVLFRCLLRITRELTTKTYVFRFSVSKWIHLNGGDASLKVFIERVYGALVPGGTFILEA
jgi:hypothetical protein